ncbi:ATP-binding protein [Prochlorothrix hollandica]|uniref:ATP-binding protein n=1 Tax=Prochlorothrix hollandica TaxID=1223 RepID=UPI0003488F79|nr:ATP-binding protein [Prochlorothrix hollandica]
MFISSPVLLHQVFCTSLVFKTIAIAPLVAASTALGDNLETTEWILPSLEWWWVLSIVLLGWLGFTVLFLERQRKQQHFWNKTIKASEQQFRLLIREMPVGVLLLNGQGEVLIHNRAALDLLGLDSLEEVAGSKPIFGQGWPLMDEQGQLHTMQSLPVQQAIAQRSSIAGVVGVVSSDRPRWLLVNVDPQVQGNDPVERVTCTLSDLTERKHTELALQQIAEKERAVARIIQKMRQTLDLTDIFRTTTQELRQLLTCDRVLVYQFRPDWSGILVAESVAPGWQLLIQDSIDPHLTDGTVDDPNCVIRLIQAADMVLEDEVVEDTYLKENQGGLYRQRRSYRCINDIYQAGFTDCYVKFLEQIQARAYVIVPIFCGKTLWGLLAVYQNQEPRHWEQREVKVVSQIGNQLGVAIQQAELLAQTQRQSVELQRAKEAADKANVAKSEFLASMSHELRTPLNAILGFTQLMQRNPSLPEQNRNHINIINRSGEHLLDLINDILEMSKIESGRMTLNEADFDLMGTLENLEDVLQLRARSKNLLLRFDLSPTLPRQVRTDQGKLRQVLMNLVSNAIKFTDQGHVLVRVEAAPWPVPASDSSRFPACSLSAHQPYTLTFEVEDTGQGIATEELDLLFQPFTQTSSGIQSGEGTGLGLPISRKFVELMGGTLNIISKPQQGSIFCFHVKAQVNPSYTLQAQPEARQVVGICSTPTDEAPRILVVEDNHANRILLVQLLKRVGFAVEAAEDGSQGVEWWQRWHPHLILMDMRMPVMDGYEATRQIRALVQGQPQPEIPTPALAMVGSAGATATAIAKETPTDTTTVIATAGTIAPAAVIPPPPSPIIIALTASAFTEQKGAILAAGCDDLIRKPYREDQLLHAIADALGLQYQYQVSDSDSDSDRESDRESEIDRTYQDSDSTTFLSPPSGILGSLGTESTAQTCFRRTLGAGLLPNFPDSVDLAAQVEAMGSVWIERVRHAAAQGSDDLLFQLLLEIPADQAELQQHLDDLVQNFRFDRVMDLIHV